MNVDRIQRALDKYLEYIVDNLTDSAKEYDKFLEVLQEEINQFLRGEIF